MIMKQDCLASASSFHNAILNGKDTHSKSNLTQNLLPVFIDTSTIYIATEI